MGGRHFAVCVGPPPCDSNRRAPARRGHPGVLAQALIPVLAAPPRAGDTQYRTMPPPLPDQRAEHEVLHGADPSLP
jgi:hypothetical protein